MYFFSSEWKNSKSFGLTTSWRLVCLFGAGQGRPISSRECRLMFSGIFPGSMERNGNGRLGRQMPPTKPVFSDVVEPVSEQLVDELWFGLAEDSRLESILGLSLAESPPGL